MSCIPQNQQDIIESCVEESQLDKTCFEQWENDNKQFVETKASKEVERLITCQNIVIVTGHTGSGKSAIVNHTALKYRSQGWKVKPVWTVIDVVHIMISTYDLEDRILFVLSDPIGKELFDELEYTLWRKYEDILKASFKSVKILMSCRKYIMNDDRVKGLLNDKAHIVDLSNDNFILSTKEKENIWNKYDVEQTVSRKELEEICQTET